MAGDGDSVDLATMLKCLADHYAWNEELSKLRELASALRAIADEVDGMANEREEYRNRS